MNKLIVRRYVDEKQAKQCDKLLTYQYYELYKSKDNDYVISRNWVVYGLLTKQKVYCTTPTEALGRLVMSIMGGEICE